MQESLDKGFPDKSKLFVMQSQTNGAHTAGGTGYAF